MPKIVGSMAEHRQIMRSRIFQAMTDLVAERGYDAISLADIAAAAGVGRTTFYNHFQDKQTLLVDVVTHETESYLTEMRKALADIDEPVLALRTYVRQQLVLTGVFRMVPVSDLRSILSRAVLDKIDEQLAAVETLLRDILAEGIRRGDFPDQDLDTSVTIITTGLQGVRLDDASPEQHRRTLEAAQELVLRAVGAAAREPQPETSID